MKHGSGVIHDQPERNRGILVQERGNLLRNAVLGHRKVLLVERIHQVAVVVKNGGVEDDLVHIPTQCEPSGAAAGNVSAPGVGIGSGRRYGRHPHPEIELGLDLH